MSKVSRQTVGVTVTASLLGEQTSSAVWETGDTRREKLPLSVSVRCRAL